MTKRPLVNQKFGDLKVIRQDNPTREAYWWICRCWCGDIRRVEERRLMSGKITMCVACEARAKMENPAEDYTNKY